MFSFIPWNIFINRETNLFLFSLFFSFFYLFLLFPISPLLFLCSPSNSPLFLDLGKNFPEPSLFFNLSQTRIYTPISLCFNIWEVIFLIFSFFYIFIFKYLFIYLSYLSIYLYIFLLIYLFTYLSIVSFAPHPLFALTHTHWQAEILASL